MQNNELHVPVMLDEVVTALNPLDESFIIDATFGNGGYSLALLNKAKCSVIAFDRDPDAILRGEKLSSDYKDRFTLYKNCFSNIRSVLKNTPFSQVDGMVFDLGVCSTQFNEAERGFSFNLNGPLDMRMSKSGITAEKIVNDFDEQTLSKIIWEFGEEKASRKIAKAIIKNRKIKSIKTTFDLKNIVHSVKPKPAYGKIDSATKTFQALRIYINDEIEELKKAILDSEHILKKGAKLVVVSFHSLEDRIVKNFFKNRSDNSPKPSRHQPLTNIPSPTFKIITKKPIYPSDKEKEANYRARSARLRVAERTSAKPTDYQGVN